MERTDQTMAEEVASWLSQYAQKSGLDITTYPGGVQRNSNWLHLPVAVHQGEDAYDRAQILQDLEDAWNNANPIEGIKRGH